MAFSDLAGDGLFYFEVRQQASTGKVWVSQMIMPYTVFFALSLAVSSFSMLVKLRLLFSKLRSRMQRDAAVSRQSLDSFDDPVQHVISKLINKKMVRICLYCHIATAMIEDLPMGVMNIVYMLRSILEARSHACAQPPSLQTGVVLAVCRQANVGRTPARVRPSAQHCDGGSDCIRHYLRSHARLQGCSYVCAHAPFLDRLPRMVTLERRESGWCLQRSK